MRFFTAATILTLLLSPTALFAADPSFEIRQTSVVVQCGNQQGSGVVINAAKGYVLTNAHVLLDHNTLQPEDCTVGFVTDQSYYPKTFYAAIYVKYVFDEPNNRDFAILQMGQLIQGNPLPSFPFLETDEFSKRHDPLTIIAYPREANGNQFVSSGTITDLDLGIIITPAFIGHGSSGGPGIDANNHLIGIARGILFSQNAPEDQGGKPYAYELVDIRNILSWLNTFGANVADDYFTHANPTRYHAPEAYTAPPSENLSCTLLAKSNHSSTVYCLKNDGTRAVFPNNTTYISWFSDFSSVQTLSDAQLAQYRLSANVTLKTGSLVKIETDPKVYIVADAAGTLRWLPNEDRAKELFGEGWAGFVKDIPVTFFSNYHIGNPLP